MEARSRLRCRHQNTSQATRRADPIRRPRQATISVPLICDQCMSSVSGVIASAPKRAREIPNNGCRVVGGSDREHWLDLYRSALAFPRTSRPADSRLLFHSVLRRSWSRAAAVPRPCSRQGRSTRPLPPFGKVRVSRLRREIGSCGQDILLKVRAIIAGQAPSLPVLLVPRLERRPTGAPGFRTFDHLLRTADVRL